MPDTPSSVVGAYTGSDPYDALVTTLKWISETKLKIPAVTQATREESFQVDPLLKGTVTRFLKNYLLSGGSVITTDNKLYEKEIKEIEAGLEALNIIGAFREDFIDFYITKGHSYRRLDRGTDGKIEYLAPIDSGKITTYTDPWDARKHAYHQQILVNDSWSDTSTTTEYNCWWIPGALPGKQWVNDGVKDEGIKAVFDSVAKKYAIKDTSNLRIGSSDDILAMHNVGIDEPAPIDSIVLAIWLKRLILVQSPNMIFRVLSPILQLKRGLVYKETDESGNERIITTVPQEPASDLATINPELYAQMTSEYTAYNTNLKKDSDILLNVLKTGGIYASGPVDEINVVESGRNLTHAFIRELIQQLNEEIGQGIGFPIALITASGSELATSRTIEGVLQKTLKGTKSQYEQTVEWLIRELFGDVYDLDEMQVHYELDSPDIKDLLAEAQTELAQADTLLKLKQLG
ncbi:MAG: hypothetical protein RBR35_16945, partial [Salinivirgaceae bacterium]|nr:hypothetical protein [Salinivirgaceae bacterium]